MNYNLIPIGEFKAENGDFEIKVYPKYLKAMKGLEELSYLQVIWWFDQCDNEVSRIKLVEEKPYKNGPEVLGTFATRTPERPNPIAVSTVYADTVERMLDIAMFLRITSGSSELYKYLIGSVT